MLSSSAVDCGFEHPLGQTKDSQIGIFYFSAKCAVLRRKSKHWMARNQDIYLSKTTCQPASCCSDLALKFN
jgi:hypothetical protein